MSLQTLLPELLLHVFAVPTIAPRYFIAFEVAGKLCQRFRPSLVECSITQPGSINSTLHSALTSTNYGHIVLSMDWWGA